MIIQLLRVSTSHSNASFNPVPFIADILNNYHDLFFMLVNPSPLHISWSFRAFGRSCLLARTSTGTF
jgi:hypothetical protein